MKHFHWLNVALVSWVVSEFLGITAPVSLPVLPLSLRLHVEAQVSLVVRAFVFMLVGWPPLPWRNADPPSFCSSHKMWPVVLGPYTGQEGTAVEASAGYFAPIRTRDGSQTRTSIRGQRGLPCVVHFGRRALI